MALKPDRYEPFIDVLYFMNETGAAGLVVVHDTTTPASGAALDDAGMLVKLPDVLLASGEYPVGMLMGDVVNLDLTRTHLNAHKRESQVGGKVGVARNGSFVTNQISGSPSAGQDAYFTIGGFLTGNTSAPTSGSKKVGVWRSSKDSDGYARVDINIV